MNLSFICSFIATSTQICKGPQFSLYAKKSAKQDPFNHSQNNGPNPFRINRRTTVEINIGDDPSIRCASDVVSKITRVMKSENIDKILKNRPARRYPMHHYKRQIKQRKGFQMSDARREAYFDKHKLIPIRDDIAFLRDKHLDKIIEAVNSYDTWLKKLPDNPSLQDDKNFNSDYNINSSFNLNTSIDSSSNTTTYNSAISNKESNNNPNSNTDGNTNTTSTNTNSVSNS